MDGAQAVIVLATRVAVGNAQEMMRRIYSRMREMKLSGDVWQQEWMVRWLVAWRSQMGLNMGIVAAALVATLSTVIQHCGSNRE